MQDCKQNRRFVRDPSLLKGKWVLLLRRADHQQFAGSLPCEIVQVDRREAILMEVWPRSSFNTLTGVRPNAFEPARTFTVGLNTLLDEYSAFSYLGPRSKFAWISPGAIGRSKNRYRRHNGYAMIEGIAGTQVSVTFVPRRFHEHVEAEAMRRAQDGDGPNPEPRSALGRILRLWEIPKTYRPIEAGFRGDAIRDWEEVFRQDHPTLVPPIPENPQQQMPPDEVEGRVATEVRGIFIHLGLRVPHHTDQQLVQLRERLRASAPAGPGEVAAQAPEPDPPAPRGPSNWERLRQR